MLRSYFDWFINSLGQVFSIFKNTKLDEGITYLSFLVFIIFARIVIGIINHIRDDKFMQSQDEHLLNVMKQHDEYREYNNWLRNKARR